MELHLYTPICPHSWPGTTSPLHLHLPIPITDIRDTANWLDILYVYKDSTLLNVATVQILPLLSQDILPVPGVRNLLYVLLFF